MDTKKIEQEFEEMGVTEVTRLFRGNIWREEKQRFAEAWLEEKAHAEERLHKRESNQIARSAKNAAWAAAIAAIIAAICAVYVIFLGSVK